MVRVFTKQDDVAEQPHDMRTTWLESWGKKALDSNQIRHVFLGIGSETHYTGLFFFFRIYESDLALVTLLLSPNFGMYNGQLFSDFRNEAVRRREGLRMMRDEIDDLCSLGTSGMTYT